MEGMAGCPCGSGLELAACCGPLLDGAPAPTAEALMRSRYSAYVLRNYEHLARSLSVEQRKDFDAGEAKNWAEASEWLGLTILRTERGGPDDDEGVVEFSARFRMQGQVREHVESATFGREDGRWVYTGQLERRGQTVRREGPKVGRNDPCPCGSGKKFKKCHGAAA
jgi:SEC-C motif-containing protein